MSARPRSRSTANASGEVLDFFDYHLPAPRPGQPERDVSGWTVVDDWAHPVPVTDAEIDVFEAWFRDIIDELFGSR